MKPTGPMKMRQHGNPNTEMNGGDYCDEHSYFQGKGKKGQRGKGKGKGKKGHCLRIKEKDKVMGKEKQTKYANPFTAGSSTFVIKCIQFLSDTFFCALDTSQDDRT